MTDDEKPSIRTLWEDVYGGTVLSSNSHGWYKATCVFHPDKNPSAEINEDVQGWTCFSCSRQGDSYGLVMQMESLEFKAAKVKAWALVGGTPGPATGSTKQTGPSYLNVKDKRKVTGYKPSWVK